MEEALYELEIEKIEINTYWWEWCLTSVIYILTVLCNWIDWRNICISFYKKWFSIWMVQNNMVLNAKVYCMVIFLNVQNACNVVDWTLSSIAWWSKNNFLFILALLRKNKAVLCMSTSAWWAIWESHFDLLITCKDPNQGLFQQLNFKVNNAQPNVPCMDTTYRGWT